MKTTSTIEDEVSRRINFRVYKNSFLCVFGVSMREFIRCSILSRGLRFNAGLPTILYGKQPILSLPFYFAGQARRIQECHITACHALMEYVEDELLQKGYLELE